MRFPFSALLGAAWVLTAGHSAAAPATPDVAGQQIYRQGSLPAGPN
jgi:hypothetical protein